MLLLLLNSYALAAPTPSETAEVAPSLARLPQAVEVPPAAYPPEAVLAGLEGAVLLRVEVDATGRVVDVAVQEPAGSGFDEAAVSAMRGARFEPALDDAGQPVAAVILYRTRFNLQRVPPLSLEGTARLSDGAPVANYPIRAVAADGSERFATTDQAGAFRFAGLAEGEWRVVFEDSLLEPAVGTVAVKEGSVAQVDLRTRFRDDEDVPVRGETVVIEATRLRTEVSERRLSKEEVLYLPGSNGDVVKVVQNLPGVARPPLGIGQLIVRGTAPEDSSAFLDGAQIPVVFHFGGLTTVLPNDLIDEVAFVPGNASVRYGRLLGGLVELKSDAEAPTEPGGSVSIDLYQTAAYVEQPVGENGGLTVALRRSYADSVLVPVLEALPDLSVRAPRYVDFQARAQAKVGETELETLLIVSDDQFALLDSPDEVEEGETAVETVRIGLATQFWRVRATALSPLGGGWQNELRLGAGSDVQSFEFGVSGEARETNEALTVREELSLAVEDGRWYGARIGLDIDAGEEAFLYDVESFGPREEGGAFRFAPALYAEATLQLGPVRVIPGLRSDALVLEDFYAQASLDPRLNLRWAISDSVALRVASGRFSQFPSIRQLLPDGDGNPELGPAWSIQSSIGLDYTLTSAFTVEATVFYNHLEDLVVGREDRLRFFSGPPIGGPQDTDPYANDGTGRVCGGELLGRLKLDNTLALVSLSVSNSVRTKRPGEEAQLFEYDQPVVLNVLASQTLPKGWRVGGRVRYGSGNPFTPVANRVYDMQSRSFIPVYAEESDRLPDFFSLDLRVDKTWEYKWGELGFYVDVQNATYAQNVEVMGWTYDYGEIDPVEGLPPLPTFGLAARW